MLIFTIIIIIIFSQNTAVLLQNTANFEKQDESSSTTISYQQISATSTDQDQKNIDEISKESSTSAGANQEVNNSTEVQQITTTTENPHRSSPVPNADQETNTAIEIQENSSTAVNLDYGITNKPDPAVVCNMSSFDHLKVTADKVTRTAHLTWDSNKTTDCDYEFKVTTTRDYPESSIESHYVTGHNYTVKNIVPCVSYNFTVELQRSSVNETLFLLSDTLETDIPEEDKVNNVTYDVTTDSIFLNWVPSPYAQICKIKYRITANVTNGPYFRLEPDTKHIVRYLSSCTYYNVTIQASDLRKRDEKDRDPWMHVINTLPEHVNNLKLNVSENYSRLTWNPPSNQECLKGYNIHANNFNATTTDTRYETNQSLICTIITIYPITKDNRLGKLATILKPGSVQNVESYPISHEAIKLYWNPPKNQTCVDVYLVKVTNHSESFTNDTSFLIVNLTACTTYEIKLYVLTKRSDYGDPYILNASTIEPAKVGVVENLISTVSDKIVTLSWDPPSNGRTCKFRYLVDVHDENKKIFRHNLTTETSLTYNFTDAIYCSQYTASVSTLSQSAQSDGNTLTIEIPQVRTAPTCTAVNVSTTRAVLECQFEDFAKNVCPIERLTVKCNDVFRLAENLSNRTKTEVTLEGLQAYSQYECTALTNTSSGESPLSDPFDFRTQQGVPNQPQVEEIASYTNTSFWISWKEVENIPGVFKDYHIQVESLGATYDIPSECHRNENQTFQYKESSLNRTSLQFSQARPSYRYQVSVQVATEAGYGPPSDIRSVITRGGIPEEPRDTNLTLLNFTSGEDYNVSAVINWIYPCFTNGPVSHFHIEILGKSNVGDQIEDHHVEQIVPVDHPITNFTYEYTLEHLKPAFLYHIFIKVVTEDKLESVPEELQFTSYESFPEAPTIKPILNVTQHSFTIEWDKPKETRGRLRKYLVHVDSVTPRYWVPDECAVNETKQHDTIELPDYENTFTYKKGMPYHIYNVSLAANNRIGSSPLTESLLTNTLEAEPEEVRNLQVDLEYSETEEYNALAKIHFDHPCHTYGIIQGINVSLIDNQTEHQFNNYYINAVSESYNKTFWDLLPERTYTAVVRVHTRAYKSEGITHVFKTNAGIPLVRKAIASPVLQDSGTATFTLSKDLFDEQNGKILYYAIILGEMDGNEKSKFGILRKTDWPTLEDDNFTANDRVRPYQATPEYWNPFEDNNLQNVTMTLGDNSYRGNKPLVPSVTYTIKVRGFTKNGYRDSPTVSFRIPSETKLGLILGLTFGIMGACVMAFVLFVIWKKRQNWSKKKESIKSILLSPIPISISNFSQYYGDLQDNGENLKLEFSLLASKSSEIVANFCHATLPANKKKNRYTNILPYDETRVKLLPVNEEEEPESDYINASYIKGYTGNVEYIATQGPLEHTVMDFWKMVIQENSSLIVMVAQFVEQNKDKCYKYFPNVHENLELENGVGIRCCTELNFKNYVVRTFLIQTETQQWTTTHLQFTDWPDFGCPDGTEVLIEFCQLMRDHAGRNPDPIIIHCSAGVGRTGTLIALDILIQAISSKSDIDIFGTVLNLRRDRKNMVQTEKQYLFIHNCVDDVIRNPSCISTADEMFLKEPIYENLNGIKSEQLGCDMQESKF